MNLLEELSDKDIGRERYRISIEHNNKKMSGTSDDLDKLIEYYNSLVSENIKTNEHLIIVIFDYDKDCNLYYYDSDYERT